jgi:hypothetical protein
MGYGAWGMAHSAWGMAHGNQENTQCDHASVPNAIVR